MSFNYIKINIPVFVEKNRHLRRKMAFNYIKIVFNYIKFEILTIYQCENIGVRKCVTDPGVSKCALRAAQSTVLDIQTYFQ